MRPGTIESLLVCKAKPPHPTPNTNTKKRRAVGLKPVLKINEIKAFVGNVVHFHFYYYSHGFEKKCILKNNNSVKNLTVSSILTFCSYTVYESASPF
jgi:hypothetical protein